MKAGGALALRLRQAARLPVYLLVAAASVLTTAPQACGAPPADSPGWASAYSPLGGRLCRLSLDPALPDQSLQRCPGPAGYRLLVIDADSRMSVTVIDPAGAEHALNFGEVVTRHFSRLGSQAEWRLAGQGTQRRPAAVIIPLFSIEDPNSTKETRRQVVARIAPSAACVVGTVPAGPGERAAARALADSAADLPCLEPLDA